MFRTILRVSIRFLIPIFILVAGVVGFQLLKTDEKPVIPPLQEQRAWVVDTQTIAKQTINPSIRLYGRVVTPSHTSLTAIGDGEIIEVNTKAGDSVQKGDILIVVDSRILQTQLRQSVADLNRISASIDRELQRLTTDKEILQHENRLLELAIESLERARTLKSRNLISQAEFDTFERAEQQAHLSVTAREASIREFDSRMAILEADQRKTEAQSDKIKLDLQDSVVVAPFDGRITQVDVAVGDHVRNGSSLLSIYDHNDLEVRAMIPNRHLSGIRDTSNGEFTPAATAIIDGHELALQLDRMASQVDQGRGGVDAYFRLVSNPARPELSRSVELSLTMAPVEDALAIPYQAIYGLDQVFIVEGEFLKSEKIVRHGHLNRGSESFVVATSDQLTDGDILVTTQLTNAVDGLRVRPSDAN